MSKVWLLRERFWSHQPIRKKHPLKNTFTSSLKQTEKNLACNYQKDCLTKNPLRVADARAPRTKLLEILLKILF